MKFRTRVNSLCAEVARVTWRQGCLPIQFQFRTVSIRKDIKGLFDDAVRLAFLFEVIPHLNEFIEFLNVRYFVGMFGFHIWDIPFSNSFTSRY